MVRNPVTLRACAEVFFSLTDSGLNGWWRYSLGVTLILLVGMLGGGLVHWMVASLPLGSAREYLAANASLMTLLLVVLIVQVFLHRRPWRSLVTTHKTIAWGRVFQGAAVWGGIMLATVSLESALYPGRYVWSFEFQSWFFFLLLALLLTPLQCAAEELFFRGYFLQAMGRIFRNPFVPAVLSSLLFTAPHLFNPEAAAHGLGILAVTYFTMGLLLALLVLRDTGLELAIGLHTVNNFFLVMCFGYKDSPLPASAIFTSVSYDPAFSLASVVVGGLIFYAWFFVRAKE